MKKSSSSIDADPITLEDIDQCNQFAISMNIDNLVDSENSKVESDNSYHSINQEVIRFYICLKISKFLVIFEDFCKFILDQLKINVDLVEIY